jgi:hypothetical protein
VTGADQKSIDLTVDEVGYTVWVHAVDRRANRVERIADVEELGVRHGEVPLRPFQCLNTGSKRYRQCVQAGFDTPGCPHPQRPGSGDTVGIDLGGASSFRLNALW